MIYFIRSASLDGPIKIGYARKDVVNRLNVIQLMSPVKLRLIGTIDGDRKTEKQIHALFYEYHLYGEWFSPASDILLFIENNATILNIDAKYITGTCKGVTKSGEPCNARVHASDYCPYHKNQSP